MNLSFLRPLALPRAATLRAFLSTTSESTTNASSTAARHVFPLVASISKPSPAPSSSSKLFRAATIVSLDQTGGTLLQDNGAHASTTTLPLKRTTKSTRPSSFQSTTQQSARSAGLPRIDTTQSSALQTGKYPYFLVRTPSKMLPIYTLNKRGGNLRQARIRKIEGDVMALKKDIEDFLDTDKGEVVINAVTRHIIIKGHRTKELTKFMLERGF